jgi:hypothetical protein
VAIGDMGMIPEPVMMQEMRPGGETQTTRPPKIETQQQTIWMHSPTEGASIVYRRREASGWSPWQLYHAPLPRPTAELEAKACRLGYRDSAVVPFDPAASR